ncbi:hypothetical protein PHLGIDRAFT_18613 [Phlebiopsis gigantea 11061_1 CR5-6]|uniref:Uncharacterized protein n=1 Tax=Phlebiopsis gigantea (strain 11061_1 CR5-6) TaxID=745531 RepID=A0A0C3SAU1_PHLG1|nr:hypothetical protein PHLGIDRAFT_18613 [Phlebiopsis gigantea 11061_1 CR5-6]
MFKLLTAATFALSAVSSVVGAAIPANRRDEASYDQAFLEPYATYNARYNTLGCASQHDTEFFSDCCHPLLIGETLEANRKAYCNPASTSATATSAPISSAVNNVGGAPPTFASSSTAVPTTTSKAPATTSKAPAEAPSTTSKAQATTTTASAATPTNTGHATWFYQHNTAGACGTVHQDTDKVIALDSAIYDNGALCGKTVTLVNLSNGKTTTATVADECPTCDSAESIDLSQGAFSALTDGDFGLGEFNIAWSLI